MPDSSTDVVTEALEPVELGVVSDTHGLVRPEALAALRGVAYIVHAGDIGAPEVLERLATVAPVFAVRGNVDHGAWAADVPETRELDVAGYRIVLTHQLSADERVATSYGANVVIFGHSHRPEAFRHDGVLFLNPGSAGPRRFRLPVAVARLELGPAEARARLIDLDV